MGQQGEQAPYCGERAARRIARATNLEQMCIRLHFQQQEYPVTLITDWRGRIPLLSNPPIQIELMVAVGKRHSAVLTPR